MESIHEFDIESEPIKESFRVDDDSKATWAIRKLHVLVNKIEENQAIRDNEVARMDEWLRSVNDKLQEQANYFIGLLQNYHQNERLANDRKTIKLPYGTLTSRTSVEKIRVNDPELFVKWAKDVYAELVRVKEEPNLNEINKVLTIDGDKVVLSSTGELAEGVEVIPASVKFKVEVEKN